MKKILITLTALILCAAMCAVPALAGDSQTEYQSSLLLKLNMTASDLYDTDVMLCSAFIFDMLLGLEEPVKSEALDLALSACTDGELYVMLNSKVVSACYSSGNDLLVAQFDYTDGSVTVLLTYGSGTASAFASWAKSAGGAEKYKKVNNDAVVEMTIDALSSFQ